MTYAVSAGNAAADAAFFVPASYDEVITVSAMTDFDGVPGGVGTPTCQIGTDDEFAFFSNFGADVDLVAPGVCVLSTWRGGGHRSISGTSMASPHVAGSRSAVQVDTSGGDAGSGAGSPAGCGDVRLDR